MPLIDMMLASAKKTVKSLKKVISQKNAEKRKDCSNVALEGTKYVIAAISVARFQCALGKVIIFGQKGVF